MSIEDGKKMITFVVTPLNLLGKQNVEGLERVGLKAVAVNRESANTRTFKEIEEGFYSVIIINPELLMNSPEILKLWKNKRFTSHILNFIFDEGHCISQWGKFRKDYKSVGNLRYLIDEDIPFYVASATLPEGTVSEVPDVLRLRPSNTKYFLRTNDRPDIHLMVRPLSFAANSFRDLDFLIPLGDNERHHVPKFLVFFDDTKEAERATRYLQYRLPGPLRQKIRWFHSTMTPEYRADELEAFQLNKRWGLCTTDAFVSGPDLGVVSSLSRSFVPFSWTIAFGHFIISILSHTTLFSLASLHNHKVDSVYGEREEI
ncbi:P-loop containing nucleoside triphosphate hydrolase protein [Amanita muscaria]